MRIARKFPATPLKTRSCLFLGTVHFFLLGSGWVEFEGGGDMKEMWLTRSIK